MFALARERFLTLSLTIAGASALAAAIVASALVGPSGRTPLGLVPIPAADIGVAWTDVARTATAIRQHAQSGLLELVALAAAGAVFAGIIAIAALSWSRSTARRDDVAVRRAVGASRRALAGSALLEGIAIGLAAAAAGTATGWALSTLLFNSWPAVLGVPAIRVAVPALILVLVAVAGALLVLRHARGRHIDPLAPGGLGLVPQVIQMALAVAVLGAAGSLARQATLLTSTTSAPGDAERFRIDASALDPAARSERFGQLLAGLAAEPGIEAAGVNSPGVVEGVGQVDWIQTDCGQCPVATIILQWHNVEAGIHVISPDTFQVLGMPMLAGRTLNAQDNWDAPRVAIVNRDLALRHFQDGNPLGRTLTLGNWNNRVVYTVVGVVDDRQAPALGTGAAPRGAVYLGALQHPPSAAELLVRRRDPLAALPEVAGLDPVPDGSVAELRRGEAALLDWFAQAVRILGLLALLAAIAGVFIGMRTWSRSVQGELAVRRALGATRWRVISSVMMFAVATVCIGAAAARMFVAPVAEWLVASLLRDPGSQALVTWTPVLLLAGAAVAGALAPAIAAVREPPARGMA